MAVVVHVVKMDNVSWNSTVHLKITSENKEAPVMIAVIIAVDPVKEHENVN